MSHSKLILSTALYMSLASMPALAFHASGNDLSSGAQSPAISLITISGQQDISTKAHDFIKQMTDRGLGFLSNKEMSEEKRVAEFKQLLHDHFDMKTIGRFALGRYWKTSTEAQRQEYLTLFEKMILKVYSKRFKDYNGQEFKVTEARMEGKADALVSSLIVPNNSANIKIDWRVREKDQKLYVIDIIVEGVSMSMTQRADFASVIQRGGGNIDALLAELKK